MFNSYVSLPEGSQCGHCLPLFVKAPVFLLRMPRLAVALAVELLTATLFSAAAPLLPAASQVVPHGLFLLTLS